MPSIISVDSKRLYFHAPSTLFFFLNIYLYFIIIKEKILEKYIFLIFEYLLAHINIFQNPLY